MEVTLQEILSGPYLRKIVDEEISIRTTNCLRDDGIEYIAELAIRSEGSLLRIPNFSRRCLGEIKDFYLPTIGVELGTTIKDKALNSQELRELLDEAAKDTKPLNVSAPELIASGIVLELTSTLAPTSVSPLDNDLSKEIRFLYERANVEVIAGQPIPKEVKRQLVSDLQLARKVRALVTAGNGST